MVSDAAVLGSEPALPGQNGKSAGQRQAIMQRRMHLLVLAAFVIVFSGLSMMYFWNLVQWSNGPDFGWSSSDNVEGLVVVSVHGSAAEAGMQEGDLITGINWSDASTISRAQELVDRDIDGSNIYSVQREGDELDIVVPNAPLGMLMSFQTYGFTWLLGIIFFGFGAIVFFMKPGATASWAFLSTMFIAGLYITFTFTSKLAPGWLAHMITFALAFQAAPIFHLAQVFPENKHWLNSHRGLSLIIPYLVSAGLFLMMVLSAAQFADVSVFWKKLCYIYLFVAIAVFFGSTLHTLFRAKEANARARARVILSGLAIGAGIPIANTLLTLFLGVSFLPHILFSLLFYSLLPISIGYSIAKHNLFDVDVYIKRAVGYVVMTALLGAGYIFLGSIMRAFVFDPLVGDVSENAYTFFFAILVVFLFGPVSKRVQTVVDRIFYRQEYNFKDTVRKLEDSLASVLDLQEIMKRMVHIVRDTLFLDTAGIVAFAGEAAVVDRVFYTDDEDGKPREVSTGIPDPESDALAALVRRELKLVTIYDLQEDVRYRDVRDACMARFRELGASLAMPVIHGDKLAGIFYLGNKKSGKLFRREDIDLMNSLTTRGAVAMENASLVQKMKQEEEVRSNLARYLSPQIVDRVVSDGVKLDLGGQRKEVSILFSDIRGFTTISETWPPDQLVTILNEYMTEMVAVVFENKGSIDKFVGDAIVAVFGSLVEVENHAQHAVEGALGMLYRLPELNRKWQQEYGVGLNIGAGINSGEVFLGNIGSPDRMEFTVIGDAVNLAARLEGLTKFYGVELVISEFTHRKLENILCRKLDLVQVKGKHNAVAIYEPVCAGCDAGDELRAELDTYEEALAAYYGQQWDKAAGVFKVLCNEHPDHKLYQLYLERIQGLRNAGLPGDWDGTFVHTSK